MLTGHSGEVGTGVLPHFVLLLPSEKRAATLGSDWLKVTLVPPVLLSSSHLVGRERRHSGLARIRLLVQGELRGDQGHLHGGLGARRKALVAGAL